MEQLLWTGVNSGQIPEMIINGPFQTFSINFAKVKLLLKGSGNDSHKVQVLICLFICSSINTFI